MGETMEITIGVPSGRLPGASKIQFPKKMTDLVQSHLSESTCQASETEVFTA